MTASRFLTGAVLCLIIAVAEINGSCSQAGCSAYRSGSTCCYGVGCCLSGYGCCPNDPTYCCPASAPVCCGSHTGCCPSGYYCCMNNTRCCKYSKVAGTTNVVAIQGGAAKATQ